MLDLKNTETVLEKRERVTIKLDKLKPAAVLIPYFIKDEKEHLLLTVRSQKVANHKGQIAFPGGNQEEGEGVTECALRETWEEVGILPKDVKIIGKTDDIVTVSSFRVTPVLARVPYPYEWEKNDFEIDEIIEVPILPLLDEKNITKNIITSSQGNFAVYYFQWGSYNIWGATGRIVANFLNLLYGKDL